MQKKKKETSLRNLPHASRASPSVTDDNIEKLASEK